MHAVRRQLAAIIVANAVCASSYATDGYFQHGYGVKPQGAGGVGIALPQDALAAAANPAGTAQVDDRADVGLTWFVPDRGADITGSGAQVNGSYDGNGKKNFFLPEFGFSRHLAHDLAAGVAVYGNGGMNTVYESGIPLFGHGTAGVNLEQLFVSPSLAWKPNENHSVGAAVNFAYQRFEAKGLQNFDPGFTTSPGNVTNNGTDTSTGWGLRLGWIGRVLQDLDLGLTWSSKIHATKFDKYKGLFADAGGFDIPENYGIGLAWAAAPAVTLAADVERIRYGEVRSIARTLASIANGLGAADGPGFGWKDVTVFKLGALYRLDERVTLRVGYNHSGQPIPADQTLFNILAPGVVQDHFSLGGTVKVGASGELSVAYTHAFKKTVSGSNSIPPGFGGGNANIHLEENVFGLAYGWMY